MKEQILQLISDLEKQLADKTGQDWAEHFVTARMSFFRTYHNGMLVSTKHGTDFFNNVKNCLNGAKWPTVKEDKVNGEDGEYGDNFRKLIKIWSN